MGPFARTLLSRTLLPSPILCYLGQILHARFSNTSFGRTLLLGSVFGRTDFFADFVAGFFSSFLWGKVPRKILQENPRQKSSKIYTTKIPDTFLQRATSGVSGFIPDFTPEMLNRTRGTSKQPFRGLALQLSAPNRAIWCDCDLRFESRIAKFNH